MEARSFFAYSSLVSRNVGHRDVFGNAAVVEKEHVIADVGDRGQVMGDENIGQSRLFLPVHAEGP